MTDFGRDLWEDGDIRADGAEVSGTTAVAQALIRRFGTARGGLFYDPSYGEGLCDMTHQAGVTSWLIEQRLESGARKDARIESCKAHATLDAETETITATLQLESAAGPFDIVIAITALEVSMLSLS